MEIFIKIGLEKKSPISEILFSHRQSNFWIDWLIFIELAQKMLKQKLDVIV